MMDIFTTALTRVLPVPIKPANLKVKALVKESATSELSDDLDHLENHEQYFEKPQPNKQQHEQQQSKPQENSSHSDEPLTNESKQEAGTQTDNEPQGDKKDQQPHLDIFV